MPWSSFFECWDLSQLFHSPLSLSSRDSLVPLLPLGWYHLHIWGYWYFPWQSTEVGSVDWPRHRACTYLGGSKTGVVIFRGGREGRLNMRNVVLFFCFTSSMMSQPRPVKTQPLWALSPRVLFIFRCFSGCYSLQDLSSPIRDWTQAPGSESVES